MFKGFTLSETAEPAAPLAPPEPEARPMEPVNILLVDDDPRNLNVLESILTSEDYRLVRAQSADEALRALVTETFALLVLDVRMPDMSGLELAQLIKQRKRTQHLPIIFLTAYYQEDEHVLQGYDAGAVDYLNKPCNPSVLRSKVAVFVDLFRTNRALKEEVTERRQAEEQLAEKSNQVQHLVSQLRALAAELTQTEQRERRRLANILHDHIQQLLVAAKMHLTLLGREEMREETWDAIREVEAILSEAITASRSVTVELSPPILQEAGLGPALHWLARRMADKNRFNVLVEYIAEAEPCKEEERFLLFECVRELLFNSFKHAGVSEACVRLLREEGWIKIVVEDKGRGLDTGLLQQGESGTFGLFSIQQRLVHLGGNMEIVSNPGEGMRITLLVPTVELRQLVEEAPSPEGAAPTNAGVARRPGTISVLIVDDHKIVRQGLVGLMRGEPDITVVGEAEDGPHAIELARKLNPDVIIMDVNLGETSGLQITKSILADNARPRIIGLSMHEEKDMAQAMYRAGAVAYLTKDVASADLLATIRQAHVTPAGA